ncbi:MAG: SPASM domain-containing protein [Candidatus Woesearchaeota archaeon]
MSAENCTLEGYDLFLPEMGNPQRDKSLFHTVEIATTTYCNRKCENCQNSLHDRGKHLMVQSLFKKIINDLLALDFDGWISPHFYGEPLTDKRIPEFVRLTKTILPRCRVRITTNGDLLTHDLAYELVHNGVDEFVITSYDDIAFKRMTSLIEHLSMQERQKIKHRRVEDLYLMNRGGILNIRNKPVQCCNYPSHYLVIDYMGDVVLCCNDYFRGHVFGNVKNENLINIWRNTGFQRIREELKNGIFSRDICKRCAGK